VQDRASRNARTPSLEAGFGTGFALESWLGPHATFGLGAFGELSNLPLAGRLRIGIWRARSAATVESRSALFTLLAAEVAVCPVSAALVRQLEFVTCIAADLGSFQAEGEKGPDLAWSRSAKIFWAAAVLGPGIRWELGNALALEARAELGVPLVRHEFVFDRPSQVVFEIPTVGIGAALSLSAHF
jgi:hypothetical protein